MIAHSSGTSAVVEAPTLARSPQTADRIDAVDITKGALVVLMVIYHSLNYSTQYQIPFRYLFFLPPSFILISGFLLSHVYLARSRSIDGRTTRRLLARGAKLFVLFAILNIIAQFVRSKNYHRPASGVSGFFGQWEEIFVWGGSHVAAFDILLPIAYLLFLAPLLLWVTRLHRFALPGLTLGLLAQCTWLDRTGDCPSNLVLITAGVLGTLAGSLSSRAVNTTARLLPLTVPVYALHFFVGLTLGQPFLHQMLGAFLAVAIIFGFGVLAETPNWGVRRLITLGQFSLVAYIGQIALFQIYTHVFGRPEPLSADLLVMFAVALLLTVAGVEALKRALAQSKTFQALYRAVLP